MSEYCKVPWVRIPFQVNNSTKKHIMKNNLLHLITEVRYFLLMFLFSFVAYFVVISLYCDSLLKILLKKIGNSNQFLITQINDQFASEFYFFFLGLITYFCILCYFLGIYALISFSTVKLFRTFWLITSLSLFFSFSQNLALSLAT